MKILFPIGSYFPAQSGGPDNTLHWLISEIAKDKNFNITVATTLYGINDDMQKQYGIIPNQPKFFSDNYSATYFKLNNKRTFSPALMKWLIKDVNKFDLVFITSFFNHHSMLAALLCKLKKIPFIISPRGELKENAFEYANKSKFLKLVYSRFFRLVNKKLYFHATSIEESESIKKHFPGSDIRILPNLIPVNNEPVNTSERKGLLYLGRLNKIKGIEILIEAYSLLPDEIKIEHPLIIAGSGNDEYIESLKEKIKSNGISANVIFRGHVTGKEKTDLYLNAKVFVLPSYSENFANVVLESISNGLYVITSKNTPWQELAENKIGSWIQNDPDIIFNEIRKILSLNLFEYNGMTRKAFYHIKKKYDVKNNISIYKDYILDVFKKAN